MAGQFAQGVLRVSLCVLGLVAVPWLALALARPAQAAGVVTDCSSQAGLAAAMNSGSGNITFNCGGPATIVITQPGGLLVGLGKSYRIDGGNVITLSGQDSVRLFEVGVGADLTLAAITLTHGYAASGGALLNGSGRLVLDHVTVRDSQSTAAGGAIESLFGTTFLTDSLIETNRSDIGGGIDSLGRLTLVNTTVRANRALTDGGGLNVTGTVVISGSQIVGNRTDQGNGGGLHVANAGQVTRVTIDGGLFASNIATGTSGAGGGIANNGGTLTLSNSTLSGNTAFSYGGGIYNLTGTVTLSNSTLSGNSARGSGGGIVNVETLTLTQTTLSGNSASYAGGLFNDGTLTLGNSTLSGNSAQVDGGGIFNTPFGAATLVNVTLSNRVAVTGTAHNLYLNGGVLTLTNTIVNFDATSGANCFGAGLLRSVSGGHNLANDTSCGLTSSGDQQGPLVPILLGPLLDHGGPTLTQLPRLGSAAIDNGDNAACAGPPVDNLDQRGVLRPLDGNGDGVAICDIGAVERRPSDTDSVPWLWLPLIVR